MGKFIHVFKSISEQESFHRQLMIQSTVMDRFRKLYKMQQINSLLHPVADKSRKIYIRRSTVS